MSNAVRTGAPSQFPAKASRSSNGTPVIILGFVLLLIGAWFLARRDADALHGLDGLSWHRLTFKSWFMSHWAANTAKMLVPAAASFAIGWKAHRRIGSAVGAGLAGGAVVFLALWQSNSPKDHSMPPPVAAASAKKQIDASILEVVKAPETPASQEPEPEAQAKVLLRLGSADEAEKRAKEKEKELALAEQAAAELASRRARPAAPAPEPVAIFRDPTILQVQPASAQLVPPSGPGVMPPPPTAQAEANRDHPSFPGCRWETSTNWVCDTRR